MILVRATSACSAHYIQSDTLLEMKTVQNASLLASLLLLSLSAAAEQLDTAATPPFKTREHLTGNWGSYRDKLADYGLSLEAENIFEYSEVVSGGIDADDSYRNLFTAAAKLETAPVFGFSGGTFFVQFLSVTREHGGSSDSGDLQVYSNIENDRSLAVIYEFWYEQTAFDEQLRIKFGKVDANSEFAYVGVLREFGAAGELTNSSAGFQPTILGFPSYPDPATSVNLFLSPSLGGRLLLTLAYGFYDGALAVDGVHTGSRGPSSFFRSKHSNDYMHFGELQLGWETLGNLASGSLGVGGWHHTGEFETFSAGQKNGTSGAYLSLQQKLLSAEQSQSNQGLYAFAQLGFSSGAVSEIERVYSAGFVSYGLGSVRPEDKSALYASFAELSDAPGADLGGNELALEALYRLQLLPWVYFQPGVQLIVDPSGSEEIDDAFLVQCRLGVLL